MMKILYFLLLVFISTFNCYSQVGMNTIDPNPSSTLEVYSENMGITMPNVSLSSYTDVTTVPNPKESLIVYNTNTNLYGKQGYYYWNGAKWDYFINEINQSNIINHTRYYSATSQNKYTFNKSTNQFYGEANHNLGENITANPTWTEVTELAKNITIDRANNQLLITLSGMVHANNSSASGRAVASFGFFVDNKLVDIKPISIDFDQTCSFREFTIYAVTNNLTTGNHTIKLAIRNRTVTTSQNDLSITFGGKNPSSSCTNISDDEAKLSATIFINQPYEF